MQYLDWLAIQEAHGSGCEAFHMGDSGPSTSLWRTRRAWVHQLSHMPSIGRASAPDSGHVWTKRLAKRAISFRD